MLDEFEQPGQLPNDIVLEGTSSSVFPAGDDLFVPIHVVPRIETNTGVTPTPARHITIQYMSQVGMRSVHVPWTPSLTVARAFSLARNLDSIFKHVNVFGYARVVGRRRVKLNFTLFMGDVIELNDRLKPFR